ncbi:MAG: ArnT family glycosyltransferase [Bacteroidota bacterium]
MPVELISNAAKYAQVSREILINQDWINLTIAEAPYDQKPPLLFWIGAFSFQLFGFSVVAYKLAVILISLLGIYSTYKLGKLLYGKKTGLLATVFWVTSVAYLHFHNDIHTDTLLATFVVFSVWQFALFFRNQKWHQFVWGSVGIGLAMLTKGPVGVAIPAFAIGADLLLHKRFKDIFNIRWIAAILIIGVIISPALIGLVNQFGAEGIIFYFWTNNVGRITGTYAGSNTDPIFYIHNALYVLAPWTIFGFTAIVLEIKELIKTKAKSEEFLTIGAILLYLIVLSIAKQKNPHYMLAVVPFIFILSAKWALKILNSDEASKLKRFVFSANRGLALILILLSLVFTTYFYPETTIFYWFFSGILLITFFYLFFRPTDLKKQTIMLALSAVFLLFSLNTSILPSMLQYQSSIDASRYFDENAPEDATLSIYGPGARYWELFLYSKNPGRYLLEKDDFQNYERKEKGWYFTDPDGLEELKEMEENVIAEKIFLHKTVTRQSLPFLNPKTREQHFKQLILARIE